MIGHTQQKIQIATGLSMTLSGGKFVVVAN